MRVISLALFFGATVALGAGCPASDDDDMTTAAGTTGTQATDTGEETGEPGTDTGEPGTDTGEPGTETGEPGTETGEPGTDTGTDTGSTGDCHDVSVQCFETEFTPLACGSPETCDELEVNDPSLNEFGEEPFGFANPEAATCILESLRDGVVGTYRVAVEPGQQYSRDHRLEVLADGSVIIHASVQDDKCIDEYETWEVLRDAADFEACLLGTEEEQLDCIRDPGNATCIESDVCP